MENTTRRLFSGSEAAPKSDFLWFLRVWVRAHLHHVPHVCFSFFLPHMYNILARCKGKSSGWKTDLMLSHLRMLKHPRPWPDKLKLDYFSLPNVPGSTATTSSSFHPWCRPSSSRPLAVRGYHRKKEARKQAGGGMKKTLTHAKYLILSSKELPYSKWC